MDRTAHKDVPRTEDPPPEGLKGTCILKWLIEDVRAWLHLKGWAAYFPEPVPDGETLAARTFEDLHKDTKHERVAKDIYTQVAINLKTFKDEIPLAQYEAITEARDTPVTQPQPPQQDASELGARTMSLKDGFPLLIKTGSRSDTSIPKAAEHQAVTPVIRDFGSLSDKSFDVIKNLPNGILLYRTHGPERSRKYGSESDIVRMVANFIEAIVEILDVQATLTGELGVFNVRADLWLLTRLGVPIGAVEVKKPDKGNKGHMDHPRVLGELYDQLLQLSNFYGAKIAIGILITGEEVRVGWIGGDGDVITCREDIAEETLARLQTPSQLPHTDGTLGGPAPKTPSSLRGAPSVESGPAPKTPSSRSGSSDSSPISSNKDLAQRDSPPGISPTKIRPRRHNLRQEDEAGGDDGEEEVVPTSQKKDDRKLNVTNTVPLCGDDGHEGVKLVISAILKMTKLGDEGNALADGPFSDLTTRQLICLEQGESFFWSRDLRDLTPHQVHWDVLHALRAKYLFLVEDLGHGDNGRVWLASTRSGYVYVLKYAKQDPSVLHDECRWWHTAYPEFQNHVAVEMWGGHIALRMPHFYTIKAEDRRHHLSEVRQTLRQNFDEKGLMHTDVSWRNIGFYTQECGEVRAVVFDIQCNDRVDGWIDDAMSHLASACLSPGAQPG